MFREINEAMGVLGDQDKREKYDKGFDLEDINSGKADMPNFAHFDHMDEMDAMPGFMFMDECDMSDMEMASTIGIDINDIF